MSKTFGIYIKNYENMEISTEKEFSEKIYKALSLMFMNIAMVDFKASLEGPTLHIRTNDSEEFGWFCDLYSKAVTKNYDLMKVIALNKDA